MRSKYIHTVNYYETDKMGITHHSNYIRFMEEARMSFLSEIVFISLQHRKTEIQAIKIDNRNFISFHLLSMPIFAIM